MSEPRIVRFYLHATLKRRAETGDHNFIAKLSAVLLRAGYRVEYRLDSPQERLKSVSRRGYSMFLMEDPFHDRALTMRLNYFYPFWNIQKSARRWEWPVATTRFDPAQIATPEASAFTHQWRKRLFKDAAGTPTNGGFVYVPLQGKLLNHRSFQFCSPIEMIDQILAHDRKRRVIVTFHPKETYSPEEISAVEKLATAHSRLTIQTDNMETLLSCCDYVATQNSAVALSGYFFHKPAVLFGRIDFHHIAANAHDMGAPDAILAAPDLAPAFDTYLYWFLQVMSINAGRPEAEGKIEHVLKHCGWKL